VGSSDVVQALGAKWMDGTASFPEDLTKILSSFTTGDAQNLAAALALTQMAKNNGQPA
jgi:hypothetical protein